MALRWCFFSPPTTHGATSWTRKHPQPQKILSPLSFPLPAFPRISHGGHTRCSLTTVNALLDGHAINTSLRASSNLVALCGFIILMQRGGHLPSDVAPVLSQVSFKLVIPSFLMSKVASTISAHADWRFLALPMMAFFQVALGSVLGVVASIMLYPDSSNSSHKTENYDYLTKRALLTTACAFGNTVTLPLVFLSGILSQSDYNIAAGYLALYMMGWSPCLWSLGYRMLSSTSGSSKPVASDPWKNVIYLCKQIMNPPLYGVILGLLIGATPLSCLCSPAKHKLVLLNTDGTIKLLLTFYSVMTAILRPLVEGARLLGSAAVPLQTIVLATTVASSMGFASNQQIMGTNNNLKTSVDGKAFWVSTIVRLVIIPCISLIFIKMIQRQGWFHANPLSILVLLVVSAMPTAQNLVVLAQLSSTTMPFAGALANILLRQYLIAVVSLTIWMPIFLTCVGLRS